MELRCEITAKHLEEERQDGNETKKMFHEHRHRGEEKKEPVLSGNLQQLEPTGPQKYKNRDTKYEQLEELS